MRTIVALIVLLLTLGGAVLYFKNFPLEKLPARESPKQTTINLLPQPTQLTQGSTTQKTNTAPVKTYHDEQYGFSFDYPSDFRLEIEQPFSKYRGTYPQKIIQIIPPYESFYHIEVTVRAGVPKKGDSTICLNKEVVIGKQKKTVTEVSCGDAGWHGRTYTISLTDKMVLEIMAGVQGEDEPTTENDLQSILNSFEFSK